MKMKLRVVEDWIMIFIAGALMACGCELWFCDSIFHWHYDILTSSVFGPVIVIAALVNVVLWGIEFNKDVNNLQESQ